MKRDPHHGGGFRVRVVLRLWIEHTGEPVMTKQKVITVFASIAMLITTTMLVHATRQAVAQPQDACLEFIGCSH
jgi:hypothetical protein